MPGMSWLDHEHPIFKANVDMWRTQERRLRGSYHVLKELQQFDWEQGPKGADFYKHRQSMATYMNFPLMYAAMMVGHLMRHAPEPGLSLSFGGLGDVPRERRLADPSRAELVYYNVDGVGNAGSKWDPWWAWAMIRAINTGHRWHFVESPTQAPDSERAEARFRPYLVDWSPTRVQDWHEEDGALQYAIIRLPAHRPRRVEDRLETAGKPDYYVVVRPGFDGLGAEYEEGGWWRYDGRQELLEGSRGHGRFTTTGGEIPMWPLYYRRDTGTDEHPAMSMPGTFELGQLAIGVMNQESAADFDAWDAAKSLLFILGGGTKTHDLVSQQIRDGSRLVTVPPDPEYGGDLKLADTASMGVVPAEVFQRRIEAKQEAVRQLASMQTTGTPDASGYSKEVGFIEGKGPVLKLMGSELSTGQNTAIHMFERRFGVAQPSGSVRWPSQYDITPLVEKIARFLTAMTDSGLVSPTLGRRAVVRLGMDAGLVSPTDNQEALEQEIDPDAAKPVPPGRTLDQEVDAVTDDPNPEPNVEA